MSDGFRVLIDEYKARVAAAVADLRAQFGSVDLRNWRQIGLPQAGSLGGVAARYAFHGSGCTVTKGGQPISWELDPERDEVALYAPKIADFAKLHLRWYSHFSSWQIVEEALRQAESDGWIRRKGDGDSDLYYTLVR